MVRRTFPRAVALIVFIAFSVGIGCPTAKAQRADDDLNALNQQVDQLYRAGKYAEATEIAERALALAKRQFGPSHAQIVPAVRNLADLYRAQGRYAEAEPFYKTALDIEEKALGPDHPDVGTDLGNLAGLYRSQGRNGEAEPLYKRAIAVDEKALGPEHLRVGTLLNNLALLHWDQGRYAEAEPLYKRALAITEKALGPDHPGVATLLNNLAALYDSQGRYAEAEPLYKRALAITEKALGPDHPDLGVRLNNLAELYRAQGRHSEAEPLYKRALAIDERTRGPEHPDVGTDLNNLAWLYRAQGRYGEAEPLYKRSLAIFEKTLGPDHWRVATSLNNLADLYRAQGRYGEAEPLYKRAITIDEKVRGPDHPEVGRDLNNLAALYQDQGRYGEAEPLYKRALAITEKALGPEHPQVGIAISFLASLYYTQGRYADAEPLTRRALAINEKALGPEHSVVGHLLNSLADLYRAQGRYSEAEPLLKRAFAIDEKALGPEHPDVGHLLNSLADLYRAQGRYGEAEPLYKRALAIAKNALGPDHPDVGTDLNGLADLYFRQSDWTRAAEFWRESTNLSIRRAQRGTLLGEALTGKRQSEATQLSWQFWCLVKVAHRLASEQHDETRSLRDMFQTAQWAQSSAAAESLSQMAARGAKNDPRLAALVRERQDLVAEWQKRDQVRSAAVAQAPEKRNAQAYAENVARLAAIDARTAEIDKRLNADFPDYAALASPAPLSVEEVQAHLAADEVLVLFLDTPALIATPEETFIWVVTKTDVRWARSGLGTSALVREVAALRCGLDYQGAWIDSHCSDLLNSAYTRADHDVFGKALPFDLARAHALYKGLFGEIEDVIRDKRLFIVPSGPLTQLPFQMLVTQPPKIARPISFGDYRDVAWLARKHAITMLPAVSSLKALRALAKNSHATETYIGFGNPLLDGEPEKFKEDEVAAKLAREKRCDPTLRQRVASVLGLRGGMRAMSRSNGGGVDVADLHSWAPLPETADELCDVAHDLGVDPRTHVYLGAMATEIKIKQLSEQGSLAKYKIIHFATHGAVAGQVSGASEPGLLLTPPDTASEGDDGYLTASEIAGLKLDADWVILSACNTAAGGTQGAEALSGLARAFFYAGARSLLVSHWEVASESTVKLITKAIAELKADPKIGRAEALRRSMLSMIDTGKEYEAHPAFWAPFVLVGEGGAGR
jgi:tetratricopeptide (TPR) repeat protein/CHAT domain-containing protein